MTLEYRPVDGVSFAEEASRILTAAWPQPSLHYSSAYLSWQLSFPGPFPAPAVAAFDGSTVAGFAAAMNRRLRLKDQSLDVLLVSFVAVHPAYRNRGVAGALYGKLLQAIHQLDAPVITFGQENKAGQRAIEREYPRAGYTLQPLGVYPVYGFLPRPALSAGAWEAAGLAGLRDTIGVCAGDSSVAWSHPTDEQFAHYLKDPRQRQLLLHRGADGRPEAAAWIVRVEYAGPNGLDHVPTIDSTWLRPERSALLPSLGVAAARLWADPEGRPAIVQAPSLAHLDPQTVRGFGFRQVTAPFHGYGAYSTHPNRDRFFYSAVASNMEVV